MNPELAALQRVINDTHALMQVLQDPAQVSIVAQCLKALTGVQKEMMQPANGQQAVLSQLAGAQQQQAGPQQQGGPQYG